VGMRAPQSCEPLPASPIWCDGAWKLHAGGKPGAAES